MSSLSSLIYNELRDGKGGKFSPMLLEVMCRMGAGRTDRSTSDIMHCSPGESQNVGSDLCAH